MRWAFDAGYIWLPLIIWVFLLKGCLKQFIGGYGQLSDAFSCGVEYGVGDRGADSGDADLADAPRAHRGVRVRLVGPDHIDLGHIQMHWHVILCERRVHDPSGSLVE